MIFGLSYIAWAGGAKRELTIESWGVPARVLLLSQVTRDIFRRQRMTANADLLSSLDKAACDTLGRLPEEGRINMDIRAASEEIIAKARKQTEELLKQYKPHVDLLVENLNVIIAERLGPEFSVEHQEFEQSHHEVLLKKRENTILDVQFPAAGDRGSIDIYANARGYRQLGSINILSFGLFGEPNPLRIQQEKILNVIVLHLVAEGHYHLPTQPPGMRSRPSSSGRERSRTL